MVLLCVAALVALAGPAPGAAGVVELAVDGELRAAINQLVGLGSTIWRVDMGGNSDWEAANDDGDPFGFNWAYYNAVYEGPEFQALWAMLAYLDEQGATIELSAGGVLPAWMGGEAIPAGQEDEFVETIASVAAYARHAKGARFLLLSPLNETDFGPPEGPKVDAAQFARIMRKLVARLGAVGLGDVALVGPHTTNYDRDYTAALLANSAIMARTRAFAYHNYVGCCADYASDSIRQSAYPDRQVWVGEWSQCATDGCLDTGQVVADEWAFARDGRSAAESPGGRGIGGVGLGRLGQLARARPLLPGLALGPGRQGCEWGVRAEDARLRCRAGVPLRHARPDSGGRHLVGRRAAGACLRQPGRRGAHDRPAERRPECRDPPQDAARAAGSGWPGAVPDDRDPEPRAARTWRSVAVGPLRSMSRPTASSPSPH